MNITIISVGKIKEKYIRLGIKEFSKRLSRYAKIKHITVDDEKTIENASNREEEIIKEKEAERIINRLNDRSYKIGLCIDGKQLSSIELSEKIKSLRVTGKSDVTFIIGGSIGLSEKIISKLDYKLSFSKMTFPHQLMKLILLEQIYRSFRIINNEPYHK